MTGQINDKIVTDYDDSEKVLASVVAAIYAFCDKTPDALINATGNTSVRTKFYRMGINKYYDIAQEDFMIFGETESEWGQYFKEKTISHS